MDKRTTPKATPGSRDRMDDEIVQLLTEHQNMLLGYIRASVSDWATAKDILQEVNLLIYKKASEFELGTNFKSWSLNIARFRILSSLRDRQRDQLVFDDETLSLVASDIEEIALANSAHENRLDALEQCVNQLPDEHSSLLKRRYFSGEAISDLATTLGRSASAIKMTLMRVRQSLQICINTKLRNTDSL